jgi:hypothetical protein
MWRCDDDRPTGATLPVMFEGDKPTPSLYQLGGGEAAIRRLVDCF